MSYIIARGEAYTPAQPAGGQSATWTRQEPLCLQQRRADPCSTTRIDPIYLLSSHTLTATMTTPNAARLASLSTKTLTLALERQRLISISTPSSSPLKPAAASSTSVAQIARNMTILHDGIIQLETVQGASKESKILRDQYKSVIDVLGEQEAAEVGVQS